ncbi:MAG: methylenetetrahydrofolate reductase [NAD(P)H] [Planctomycetota bacterium]
MHAADHYTTSQSFSFEFFPPKTPEGSERLFHHIEELQQLAPSFVSVTYGAGGGTRELTQRLVVRLKAETSLAVVPHLTCVTHTESEIAEILETYAQAGIRNILCLGGDPPKDDPNYDRSGDRFRHAIDLVNYVHEFNAKHASSMPDARGFGVLVAGFPEGHPATPNRLLEMDYLKAKVDSGSHVIVTQLFFDNRDFYDFRDRCRLAGITVPIVAGIMPITSAKGLRRMAELAACSRFPAPLLKGVQRAIDSHGGEDSPEAKDAVRRVGVHWATEQSRDLIDHDVDGIHFYTLNHSTATAEIYKTLGVRDSSCLTAGASRPASPA